MSEYKTTPRSMNPNIRENQIKQVELEDNINNTLFSIKKFSDPIN